MEKVFLILCFLSSVCLGLEKIPRAKKTFGTEKHLILDGKNIRHKGGEVFAIRKGKYQKITIRNFKGKAGKPVIFVNSGGVVEVDNTSMRSSAIGISNCHFVRLTGLGSGAEVHSSHKNDPLATKCGIRARVGKNGPHTLNVTGESTNIEIDHIEVFGAGFAGFNIKDEPSQDLSTNRGKYTMYNISVHDNHVHHTKGEGFYIGHTFYNGYKQKGKTLLPHVIKGLRIYNNYLHHTGCEAIQVGSVEEDCEIYNNMLIHTGVSPFAKHQNSGLQIGMGTQAKVYNNYISDVPGAGIVVFGHKDTFLYNNVISKIGGSGIITHNAGGDNFWFVHNTVVDCKGDAIHIGNWNNRKLQIEIKNNIVGSKSRTISVNGKNIKLRDAGNYELKSVSKAAFKNHSQGDFNLTSNSPARKKGSRLSYSWLKYDYFNQNRSSNSKEAGAILYNSKPSQQQSFRTERPPTPWNYKKP